jgi:hypothetical protein
LSRLSLIRRRERRSERGAAAITVVLLLGALCGFLALAFNVGLIVDTRTELQNGSDSAALAGARSLNGMATGLTAARQSAYDFSMQHIAYEQPITIDTFADLTFGTWHLRADECVYGSNGRDCFEPIAVTDPRNITAVKIRNGRDGGTHNAPLSLPFGAFVGSTTASVRSAAVAVGGGPGATSCALPMTVAQCAIVDPGTNQMNCAAGTPQQLVFSDANADGIGFVNLYYPADTQAPDSGFVANVINTRLCNPSNYVIGPAKLQNGNDFGKVIDALRGVDNKGNVIGSCLLNKSMSWAVTDAGCPDNPIFQGVHDVVGFVKATIVAVTDNKGNALGCPGDTALPVDGNPKNGLVVKITCDASPDPGDFAGGRAFNTSNLPIRLVQ